MPWFQQSDATRSWRQYLWKSPISATFLHYYFFIFFCLHIEKTKFLPWLLRLHCVENKLHNQVQMRLDEWTFKRAAGASVENGFECVHAIAKHVCESCKRLLPPARPTELSGFVELYLACYLKPLQSLGKLGVTNNALKRRKRKWMTEVSVPLSCCFSPSSPVFLFETDIIRGRSDGCEHKKTALL